MSNQIATLTIHPHSLRIANPADPSQTLAQGAMSPATKLCRRSMKHALLVAGAAGAARALQSKPACTMNRFKLSADLNNSLIDGSPLQHAFVHNLIVCLTCDSHPGALHQFGQLLRPTGIAEPKAHCSDRCP